MQVRGTFPELNAGMKKSGRSSSLGKLAKAAVGPRKAAKPARRAPAVSADAAGGFGGFASSTKPRPLPPNPRTFAGRRDASHNRAYPNRNRG